MAHRNEQDFSDAAELKHLKKMAQKVFGLEFDTAPVSEASHNMIGLRSESVLFSRRLDSRTYFVQDSRYGWGKPAGVFRGDDGEQIKLARGIMKRVGVALSEIHDETVLTEKLAVGRLNGKTGAVDRQEAQDGRTVVRMSRRSGDLPVWSSLLLLGLRGDMGIGFLQFHWPVLPEHVVQEAQRLAFKVKDGWHPPEHRNAEVETVEAGVVHSPAAGFAMDIHAAIRIIYAPVDKRLGGKAMLYLNRHGQPVLLRQHAEVSMEPSPRRKKIGIRPASGAAGQRP
jgi:hypothetical protein